MERTTNLIGMFFTPLLFLLLATLLLVTTPSYALPEKSKPNKSPAYSLNSDAISAMEQQLKLMLKKKIITTPTVNPTTALPPIILKADTDEAPDKQNLTRNDFFTAFMIAAKERTEHTVKYDGSYRYISYPMGDVAPNRGVCTDVVIRSYRKLGIDLQQLVHEDIKTNFSLYPSRTKWGNIEPDTNIDHRRVYNLQVFFKRYGESLPITNNPLDYQPGDLVTWKLGPKMPHIGVVVDEYSEDNPDQPLVVHNIGQGPQQEDILFAFPITGHYRYKPGKDTPTPTTPYPTILVKKKSSTSKKNTSNSLVEAAFYLLP